VGDIERRVIVSRVIVSRVIVSRVIVSRVIVSIPAWRRAAQAAGSAAPA
jgi:hypothetical protein